MPCERKTHRSGPRKEPTEAKRHGDMSLSALTHSTIENSRRLIACAELPLVLRSVNNFAESFELGKD